MEPKILNLDKVNIPQMRFRVYSADARDFITHSDSLEANTNSLFLRHSGALFEKGVRGRSLEDVSFKNYYISWFTGITDKNGDPIYEGDLVKILGEDRKYEVIFLPCPVRAVFTYRDSENKSVYIDIPEKMAADSKLFEVVGNVYDAEFNEED